MVVSNIGSPKNEAFSPIKNPSEFKYECLPARPHNVVTSVLSAAESYEELRSHLPSPGKNGGYAAKGGKPLS